MVQKSPFELVNDILKDGAPKTARDVAKLARDMGLDWSRENANSALYKMLRSSLVLKIETEKAPLWTLPIFADEIIKEYEKPRKNIITFKAKNIHLVADADLTIFIQGVEIQFQYNDNLSPNDPYMAGDWLNDKIFVTLNPIHPFWQTFINSEESKSLQLINIAAEVYVQWHVAKMTTPISPRKLLELRDKALRDIALT